MVLGFTSFLWSNAVEFVRHLSFWAFFPVSVTANLTMKNSKQFGKGVCVWALRDIINMSSNQCPKWRWQQKCQRAGGEEESLKPSLWSTLLKYSELCWRAGGAQGLNAGAAFRGGNFSVCETQSYHADRGGGTCPRCHGPKLLRVL